MDRMLCIQTKNRDENDAPTPVLKEEEDYFFIKNNIFLKKTLDKGKKIRYKLIHALPG